MAASATATGYTVQATVRSGRPQDALDIATRLLAQWIDAGIDRAELAADLKEEA